ncbi:MAG: hypothetical protein Q8N35_09100 [Methylococcaceae bacterium]|nr:hypothetical protein [Methylococcaceae bacterium]MDZ4156129.1 hypothetical protein [Methylococcales bacterium]MDP2393708.1 hypothetical protein [Methylococcaceae bacterium]MDP3019734.1 hypothetical protein [Methylococcaceae bacterium]MDP3390202.1 hypothetical protein [Methylococcaceae bacterium]
MKIIIDFFELLQKNIKAIINSYGYKIVKIKRPNKKKITNRLVNQTEAIAAHFDDENTYNLVNKSQFFTVQIDAKPGINHLREALNWLVRESISLNRTPLVFTPHFDNCHNFDIEVQANWDKYINLNNIQIIHKPTGNAISIQAVMEKDITGFDDLSVLWVERDHVITEKENSEFDLIIRHNKTGLEISCIHNGIRGLPEYSVTFLPSACVLDTYNQVSNKIENYCAIHVRRGDMLSMVETYPNLKHDTHPDQIIATISKVLTRKSNIYILTNERDRNYFNPLNNDYIVFQYFDFPELSELIECEKPDNFLLFEIEKLIFENANTKIYTFTHPEGGTRISLSKNLGWA